MNFSWCDHLGVTWVWMVTWSSGEDEWNPGQNLALLETEEVRGAVLHVDTVCEAAVLRGEHAGLPVIWGISGSSFLFIIINFVIVSIAIIIIDGISVSRNHNRHHRYHSHHHCHTHYHHNMTIIVIIIIDHHHYRFYNHHRHQH